MSDEKTSITFLLQDNIVRFDIFIENGHIRIEIGIRQLTQLTDYIQFELIDASRV